MEFNELEKYITEDSVSVEESAYHWKGGPMISMPKEAHDPSKPTAVDLFCGMGGLSLGFEMAGFDVLLGADIHTPSMETFKKSHPKAISVLGDITEMIDRKAFGDLVEEFRRISGKDRPDVLMAGIPCQGFSLSNKKRSEFDRRNYLFMYFMRAVDMFKPKFVLIENVKGLKSMGNGSFIQVIEGEIKSRGYIPDHRLLQAADFGVPQKRTRILFMGAERGYSLIWPEGDFGTKSNPHRTVRDAISDLPPLSSGESSDRYITYDSEKLNDYQRIMREGSVILLNHKSPKHPKSTIRRIGRTKPGKPMYDSFKERMRLSWDSPSPTQLCGGIRPQFQFGHPEQARGLTVRERTRIQSIPDRIEIFGGVVQGRVQTGNVVPPLLAKAIANCIMRSLKGEKPKNSGTACQSSLRDLETLSRQE